MNPITRFTAVLAAAAALCLALPRPAGACSTFSLKAGDLHLVGRSYDWGFGEGMVVVNKRGQAKRALMYWDENTGELARWTSRYGSVTFDGYGREIALGGMNEAGLVLQEQWLDGTRYPPLDDRPSVSVDQLVQYILDSCATVDEVVAAANRLRVRPVTNDFTKIHFFAVDASGATAILEFLQGKLVVHARESAPIPVMTNDTYQRSLAWLDPDPAPLNTSSPARFSRLARFVSRGIPAGAEPVAAAFEALRSVKQGNTELQYVFDVRRRVVHFRSRVNPAQRSLEFAALDFSCSTPARILDWNAPGSGDVASRLHDYSADANEALIRRAWSALGYSSIYPPAMEIISRYPESFTCSAPGR